MKIVANKGSKLEQVIKGMFEQLISDEKAASDFIKERVGVAPQTVQFIWCFGNTGRFTCRDIIFKKEDWEKVDKKILVQLKKEWEFNVNRRTKAGNQFLEDFDARFNRFVSHEPLEKFGIYMIKDRRYWAWQPVYDKKEDCYFILCSDAALQYQEMNKDSQFRIMP